MRRKSILPHECSEMYFRTSLQRKSRAQCNTGIVNSWNSILNIPPIPSSRPMDKIYRPASNKITTFHKNSSPFLYLQFIPVFFLQFLNTSYNISERYHFVYITLCTVNFRIIIFLNYTSIILYRFSHFIDYIINNLQSNQQLLLNPPLLYSLR